MVLAAVVIFVATYFVMAVGRLPGYRLDRAGAALLGAMLMVAFGVIDLKSAYQAIDGDTIALLLGMMIVVANLRLAGFFRLVAHWVAKRARHALILLGGLWILQGGNIIGGSVMSGQTQWLWIGIVVLIVGVVALVWSWRRRA